MLLPTVGLTGGIASGKSTVAGLFADFGVPTVDADLLAREAVLPGSKVLGEIVRVFGADVLNRDGTLNRKALGARIFADAKLRAALNTITHPRIAELAALRLHELSRTRAPYAIYEAALLVENGLQAGMRGLVVVSIDAPTQLARLRARDGLTEEEALARIASQAPLAHKVAAADFVIDNSIDREHAAGQVERVHAALLRKLA